jgi:hypothetical protein
METQLPPRPDFSAIATAAQKTTSRRTSVLTMIGNLVLTWANNESMFLYVLMLLMRTDEISASIVFATLNTTRARVDLIHRLGKVHIQDRALQTSLERILDQFNECTRVRNEFNHSMYSISPQGEITHTHTMRIQEIRGKLQVGVTKKFDDNRMKELMKVLGDLKNINRDIWDFLPRLESHLKSLPQTKPSSGAAIK